MADETPPLTATQRRNRYPRHKKSREETSEATKKMTLTLRRSIFICPIPMHYFNEKTLVQLHGLCRYIGEDPNELEFYAVLKRTRRHLLEYVQYGMMRGSEVVMARKKWADEALINLPSTLEQIDLAKAAVSRFPKVTHWCSEATAMKMLQGHYCHFEDGVFKWGQKNLGISHRLTDDRIYAGWNAYNNWKPAPYIGLT